MKISFINGVNNSNFKINNFEGTTLGELKAWLKENKDLDTDNLVFFEGHSRTSLISNSSQLPSHIMYKGTYTDDLVIMATPQREKIKSGAGERGEAYKYIKEHSLQQEVAKKFGKNFTCCKTDDLVKFVENKEGAKVTPAKTKPAEGKVAKKVATELGAASLAVKGITDVVDKKTLVKILNLIYEALDDTCCVYEGILSDLRSAINAIDKSSKNSSKEKEESSDSLSEEELKEAREACEGL